MVAAVRFYTMHISEAIRGHCRTLPATPAVLVHDVLERARRVRVLRTVAGVPPQADHGRGWFKLAHPGSAGI